MRNDIAIVIVAYNRPDSLNRLLNSLSRGFYEEDVPLYISIDYSPNNQNVIDCANNFMWSFGEKTVLLREKNMGLRKHILGCGNLLQEYEAIIVLEDDLVVAPGFYLYARGAVKHYRSDDNIAGISLYNFNINPHFGNACVPFTPTPYNYDTYFLLWAPSWGEIWLRSQWNCFYEWYKENDAEFSEQSHLPKNICHWGPMSWLKYHIKYAIEENKYFVYPYIAYSSACGDAGIHTNENIITFQVPLQQSVKSNFNFMNFEDAPVIYDAFFEREFKIDGIDDLCIDLNGLKANREGKRYWLTTEALQYKIVRSFRFTFKPIEVNVVADNEGDRIFLYDTSEKAKKPKFHRSVILYQHNIQNILVPICRYGLFNLIKDVIRMLINKITSVVKFGSSLLRSKD